MTSRPVPAAAIRAAGIPAGRDAGGPGRADGVPPAAPDHPGRAADRVLAGGRMIGKITAPRGERVEPLIWYLYGPGRANEHTDPHIVAFSRGPRPVA